MLVRRYKAKGPIKVPGGTTIRTGAWVIDVQWFLSTSDDQARKSYKLLAGETATIPIGSLVQEHGLKWEREWREGSGCEYILAKESHLALMQHNYSNVA